MKYLLLLLMLSGCVTLKDRIMYFPAGADSPVLLVHTETSTQAVISSAKWKELLNTIPMTCMSDDDYGVIKIALETACNDLPTLCVTDTTEEPAPAGAISQTQMKKVFKKIEFAFNRSRKRMGLPQKKYD